MFHGHVPIIGIVRRGGAIQLGPVAYAWVPRSKYQASRVHRMDGMKIHELNRRRRTCLQAGDNLNLFGGQCHDSYVWIRVLNMAYLFYFTWS